MRVVEFSNHPGLLLRDIRMRRRAASAHAQAQYEDTLAGYRRRLQALRDQRDRARAQRRWWEWLRGTVRAWRARRAVPRRPVLVTGRPTRKISSGPA
jgi:hypothetical protein